MARRRPSRKALGRLIVRGKPGDARRAASRRRAKAEDGRRAHRLATRPAAGLGPGAPHHRRAGLDRARRRRAPRRGVGAERARGLRRRRLPRAVSPVRPRARQRGAAPHPRPPDRAQRRGELAREPPPAHRLAEAPARDRAASGRRPDLHHRPAAHGHLDPARAARAGSGTSRAAALGGAASVPAAGARRWPTPTRASSARSGRCSSGTTSCPSTRRCTSSARSCRSSASSSPRTRSGARS